jgi:hypothetical protein
LLLASAKRAEHRPTAASLPRCTSDAPREARARQFEESSKGALSLAEVAGWAAGRICCARAAKVVA